MRWNKNVKGNRPRYTQPILVTNVFAFCGNRPILATYEHDTDLFFPLYNTISCPLQVTHWMDIDDVPEKLSEVDREELEAYDKEMQKRFKEIYKEEKELMKKASDEIKNKKEGPWVDLTKDE